MLAAAGKDAPDDFIPGKGRIERLFGALQDRLVAELRLAGIADKDAANAFLPRFLRRYNARFAQPPARPQVAYRPWPAALAPDTVFCFKYSRIVANDHTVAIGPDLLQILPDGRSYAKARVEVHQRLKGTYAILYHGRPLPLRRLTPAVQGEPIRVHQVIQRTRPKRRIAVARSPSIKHSRRTIPAANHPWRQYDQVMRLKAAKAQRTKSLVG